MANKILQKSQFKPGINREGTNYAAEGGWWDCKPDLAFERSSGADWRMDESLGNANRRRSAQALNWQTDGSDMMGVATSKVYIESGGGFSDHPGALERHDGQPAGKTTFANSVLLQGTTTAPHGAQVGDYVTVSGASVDFDGDCVVGQSRVSNSLGAHSDHVHDRGNDTVVGGPTSEGPAVTFAFQLGIGADYAVSGTGWGMAGRRNAARGSAARCRRDP